MVVAAIKHGLAVHAYVWMTNHVHLLATRRREVLPVPYFHLVFTLPHALNGLITAAPRRLYEALFAAVAATLGEFAGSRRHLGGVPAFSLVLHTWKQDLGRHVHLHALIAGGALAPGGEWLAPKKEFLFPVRALSKVFRGKFVATLEHLHAASRLPRGDPERRLAAAAQPPLRPRLGGLCQAAAGRARGGAGLPCSLHAPGGNLQRAHPRHRW
jgi:hypothetical protein